jgi:hypothetical protein
MKPNRLERDVDFFLTIDLVFRAAVKLGIDPMEPRLSLADCKVDETGVTFASGIVVRWSELGLGNLCRIDRLFSEYVGRLPPTYRESVTDLGKSDAPFAYSPRDAEWFFRESEKERLFERWGNQLAVGANSFVL